MKTKVILLCAMIGMGVSIAYAKRAVPKAVPPVTYQGIIYSAPHFEPPFINNQNGGYLKASSVETGKTLWKIRIYEVKFNPALESDVQDVFITSLKLSGGTMEIMNERHDKFVVDLAKHEVIKGKNRVYDFNE